MLTNKLCGILSIVTDAAKGYNILIDIRACLETMDSSNVKVNVYISKHKIGGNIR
jgi:hypothetical protein